MVEKVLNGSKFFVLFFLSLPAWGCTIWAPKTGHTDTTSHRLESPQAPTQADSGVLLSLLLLTTCQRILPFGPHQPAELQCLDHHEAERLL